MENETETTTPEHRSKLLDVLMGLEHEIKKQNSLKYALVRGIVYGLGTVIGASVLVTVIAGLLQKVTDLTITF